MKTQFVGKGVVRELGGSEVYRFLWDLHLNKFHSET